MSRRSERTKRLERRTTAARGPLPSWARRAPHAAAASSACRPRVARARVARGSSTAWAQMAALASHSMLSRRSVVTSVNDSAHNELLGS